MKKIFSIILIVFSACSPTPPDEYIEFIDVKKNSKNVLSHIFDGIEYLVLEPPQSYYIHQIDKVLITDDLITIGDYIEGGKLLNYKKDGTFFSEINHLGGGPGEYNSILDFSINQESNTIEIFAKGKLVQYDKTGQFIQEIQIPFRAVNFHPTSNSQYLFYVPEYAHTEMIRPKDRNYVLYKWKPNEKNLSPIISNTFRERPVHYIENKPLHQHQEDYFFSLSFLDTIFQIKDDNVYKKYILDFGDANLPLKEVKNLTPRELIEKTSEENFKLRYKTHFPNLFVTNTKLLTAFESAGKFNFLIYDFNHKTVFHGKAVKNDIDQGLSSFMPIALDDEYVYTFHEPEEILQHYQNSSQLKGLDNNFTRVAKSLTQDSFLVMAKYKLKK